MPIVLKHELVKLMQDAYKEFGKTEFTTGELHEILITKFPTLDTSAKLVGASVASMKTQGIVVDLGFAPNSIKAKVFGLAEIVESITAPKPETLTAPEVLASIGGDKDEFPGAVSPESAVMALRSLNSVQREGAFTATVKEVAEMAANNANTNNNDRKPRHGTIEYDLMQMTKLADRQSEMLEAHAANSARLEKSLIDAVTSVRELHADQTRVGNELGEAQLSAMRTLRGGVLGVMETIAITIGEIAADNRRVEMNISRMIQSIEASDEVDRNGYKRGFLDGFTTSREEAAQESAAPTESPLIEILAIAAKRNSEVRNDFITRVTNAMREAKAEDEATANSGDADA